MPPNFANAKIYCIRSHQTDKVYIGSTTQTLAQRFGKHKHLTNSCSSSQILQFNDAYIELLEEFPCANKMQLNKREGELIRLHNCINKNIAGRTPSEYQEEHKTEIKEQKKQYYVDNKQEILEQNKQYRGEHKTEIKEQRKQHYVDNKQEILEKKKQYYVDNNQEILEHSKQKYNCCCGGRYTNAHKNRHFKSPKHLTFINSLETTTA